jgi:LemA protein
MSTVIVAVLIVAALPVAALLLFVASNNRLAALDARCNTAFADIDAQLKQRADLIPGLIECVRGFAAQEVKILGDVAEARKAAVAMAGDARLDVEAELGRKVGAVFSLAEKYPDLASSHHFRELRSELAAAEARVTAARRFFNLAVGEYNTRLGQYPGVLVARLAHYRARRPYDLGVERVALEDAVAFRFAPPAGAGN